MERIREYLTSGCYCLAGAFYALLGAGAFAGGDVPLSTAIALFGLATLAFALPFYGLLVFVAISPIAVPLAPYAAPHMDGELFAELLLTASLAGSLLRFGVIKRSRRPLTTAEMLALLLIALTLASAIVGIAPDYIRLSNGQPPVAWTWQILSRDYFGGSGLLRSLYDGLLLVDGLTLFIIFGMSCGPGRRDVAVRMLVVGAAAAAVFDIYELLLVFARSGSVSHVLDVATRVRISATAPDLNAAGSYFAMALLPAAAMIGSLPVAGVAMALLIAVGEMVAGSRAAFGALGLTWAVVIGVAVKRRSRRWAIVLSLTAAAVIAAVAVSSYVANRFTDSPTHISSADALAYRLGMWHKAWRMTANHPFFGIGIGQFEPNSPTYAPTDGAFSVPENAHNQFLQVMAELGIPGLAIFVAIIAVSLMHRFDDRYALAAAIGVGAFLLSALGGHPLLVRTVAYPFWVALAITNAAAARRRALTVIAPALTIIVVALATTVPTRTAQVLDTADFEHLGIGVSPWMTEGDGEKYRLASACATLYVPARARRIEIAMRPHPPSRATLVVEFWESGRLLNRIDVQGPQWTTAVFTGGMPDGHERAFSPLQLRVTGSGSRNPCVTQVLEVKKIVAVP